MKFQLGNTLRDRVSGVTGITTGYVTYLNGCRQWSIHPKADKDGKVPEHSFYDEQQLEFVDEGIAPKMQAEKKSNEVKPKQSFNGGANTKIRSVM